MVVTYETDEQEEDLKAPADGSDAIDITIAHGGHSHHEKVDALPVAQLLAVLEVRGVAGVLQLKVSSRSVVSKSQQQDFCQSRWF